MNKGLVSIIIPTFNRSTLIGATLDSVINQTYSNWECLIIDDGSSDYSIELIEFYCIKEPRISYYKRPVNFPKGPAGCRNFGFALSKGDYIQWLDDDDLLSPEKLKIQANLHLESEKNIFSLCSWGFKKDGKILNLHNLFKGEKIISPKRFFDRLGEMQTFIPIHAYLTSRHFIKLAGDWNTVLNLNEDAEYFTRVHLIAGTLINIDEPRCYALYRKHEGERVSFGYNIENFDSLMLSYKLIYSQLQRNNIYTTPYFNWKLKEVIKTFSKEHMRVIKKEKDFFSVNNISLNWYNYKNLRIRMYRTFFPIYKKFILKNSKGAAIKI